MVSLDLLSAGAKLRRNGAEIVTWRPASTFHVLCTACHHHGRHRWLRLTFDIVVSGIALIIASSLYSLLLTLGRHHVGQSPVALLQRRVPSAPALRPPARKPRRTQPPARRRDRCWSVRTARQRPPREVEDAGGWDTGGASALRRRCVQPVRREQRYPRKPYGESRA